ncbi:TPA_asm: protein 2 [Luffa virus 1]|uniref:Protein 2 n=1 Tax=Luffa virus 1 TaxID=2977973 RepID=A0A9N6YIX0_9RHAB|nr:TPA_asm: protein 2 [Luffa virus 1]
MKKISRLLNSNKLVKQNTVEMSGRRGSVKTRYERKDTEKVPPPLDSRTPCPNEIKEGMRTILEEEIAELGKSYNILSGGMLDEPFPSIDEIMLEPEKDVSKLFGVNLKKSEISETTNSGKATPDEINEQLRNLLVKSTEKNNPLFQEGEKEEDLDSLQEEQEDEEDEEEVPMYTAEEEEVLKMIQSRRDMTSRDISMFLLGYRTKTDYSNVLMSKNVHALEENIKTLNVIVNNSRNLQKTLIEDLKSMIVSAQDAIPQVVSVAEVQAPPRSNVHTQHEAPSSSPKSRGGNTDRTKIDPKVSSIQALLTIVEIDVSSINWTKVDDINAFYERARPMLNQLVEGVNIFKEYGGKVPTQQEVLRLLYNK